jgi:hypothetical protein
MNDRVTAESERKGDAAALRAKMPGKTGGSSIRRSGTRCVALRLVVIGARSGSVAH